jgi:hypothetical protein
VGEEICSAAAIRSPGLARRVFAFSNFPSRFLKLDDHLVPQFKLVLKIVVYRPQSQKPKNDVDIK